MKRVEAEKLIGDLVITSFVEGGLYIGELLEIIPSKPFRANVKVKGLYKYPSLYNHNTRPLTFKNNKINIIKENEIVNTGNSIEKFEDNLISYRHSLKLALIKYLSSVERCLINYKNDKNFYSHYIGSLNDCIELKARLEKQIENN